MAKMSLFIERLDGKLINKSLIQTVYIDPNDDTDVLWFMRNGEIYREDLESAEDATKRYNDIKGLLLGTTVAQLEQIITEQQQTIVEKNITINEQNKQINEKYKQTKRPYRFNRHGLINLQFLIWQLPYRPRS